MSTISHLWHRLRNRLLLHRRLLAALLAAVTVWAALTAVPTAAGTERRDVWVAATSLSAGSVVRATHLRRAGYPPELVPDDLITDPAEASGRTLLAPVPAGLPVTRAHLIGPGLTTAHPGRVAVSIRIPDAGAVDLLRPGDRIGLLATDAHAGTSGARLTDDAIVVAVPETNDPGPTGLGSSGRLVVLALTPSEAPTVAAAAVSRFVTIVWID